MTKKGLLHKLHHTDTNLWIKREASTGLSGFHCAVSQCYRGGQKNYFDFDLDQIEKRVLLIWWSDVFPELLDLEKRLPPDHRKIICTCCMPS